MRWNSNARLGTQRIVHKFLWLPTYCEYETRWLEFAYVLQIYGVGWENIRWMTKEEYDEAKEKEGKEISF